MKVFSSLVLVLMAIIALAFGACFFLGKSKPKGEDPVQTGTSKASAGDENRPVQPRISGLNKRQAEIKAFEERHGRYPNEEEAVAYTREAMEKGYLDDLEVALKIAQRVRFFSPELVGELFARWPLVEVPGGELILHDSNVRFTSALDVFLRGKTLVEGLRYFEEIPPVRQRANLLARFAGAAADLSPENIHQLLAIANKSEIGHLSGSLGNRIRHDEELSDADRRQLIQDYLDADLPPVLSEELIAMVVRDDSASPEIVEWVLALAPEISGDADSVVVHQLTQESPKEGLAFVNQLFDAGQEERAIAAHYVYSNAFSARNPRAAAEWSLSLPEDLGIQRTRALYASFIALYRKNVAQYEEMLTRVVDESTRNSIESTIDIHFGNQSE